MANNCFNHITIKGNELELKSFSKFLKLEKSKEQNSEFDMYLNLIAEFGSFSGDAKWFEIDFQIYEEEIIITGDSAWCPCLLIFTKIAEKFPSFLIRYEYEEMGCDFAGFAEIKNGVCDDNCFTYWKGRIEIHGEYEAFLNVIDTEIQCYESMQKLISSNMYQSFSELKRIQILTAYNEKLN